MTGVGVLLQREAVVGLQVQYVSCLLCAVCLLTTSGCNRGGERAGIHSTAYREQRESRDVCSPPAVHSKAKNEFPV